MNNKKIKSSTAIFLAAVLVAGVIGIASPSIAFADEDEDDKKYEKQGWKSKKAECSVSNFNIGKSTEFTEFESQIVNSMVQQAENPSAASIDENIDPTVEAMDASIGIESNDAGWGMESNGDGGGIDLDIENICLNFGNNDNFGVVGDGGGDGGGVETTFCHCPPGQGGENCQTRTLPSTAVLAHLTHHEFDSLGECPEEEQP